MFSASKVMREMTVKQSRVLGVADGPSASRKFWTALLIPCLAGGALFLLVGLGISGLTALGLITGSRVTAYSAVALIFGAFISMFLAAHCMDRRDAADKVERLERCRREGFKDEER